MEQIEDGRWTTESALARLVERQGSLIKKLTEQRNALLKISKRAAGDLDIITRDMIAQEQPLDPQRALELYRETLEDLRSAISLTEAK